VYLRGPRCLPGEGRDCFAPSRAKALQVPILKASNKSEIAAVSLPTKFILTLNLRTAEALALRAPPPGLPAAPMR
jgi:hypothetical protein